MARNGDTTFEPNQGWFDTILKSQKVRALTKSTGSTALAAAKASAPVETGDYQRGIIQRSHDARFRPVEQIIGTDPKTMLIEAKTGNLARAVKAAKR